jgi:spore coat polysaccharide biosynthesis protein SpsF
VTAIVIVMARMGSSRLPGKTLMTVAGEPLLQHLLHRLRRVQLAERIVVATSSEPQDDSIAAICDRIGVSVFRGSEIDTMDRFCCAAKAFNADIAVRVTADCPLIDPATVDLVIETIKNGGYDYVSTDLVPQYPNGMGCDAYSSTALVRLHEASRTVEAEQRWMLSRDSNIGLRCGSTPAPHFGDLSGYRVTVDTLQDLALVSKIVSALPDKYGYGLDDVITVLHCHPEWTKINAAVVQKTGPHRQRA